MKNDCKHYDKELDCCKWLSDWGQAMPVLQPCVESPCGHYKSRTGECPFCGGNVEIEANYLGQIYARCRRCGAKVFFMQGDYAVGDVDEFTKLWNERVTDE